MMLDIQVAVQQGVLCSKIYSEYVWWFDLLDYTGEDYRGGKTSREYLKFTNEEGVKRIKELKDIQSNNFVGMSAIEICQMLRVRHFIWLDMVLSIELAPIHLAVALDYIKQFFTFLVWYFKQFPQYYGDVSIFDLNIHSTFDPNKTRNCTYMMSVPQ